MILVMNWILQVLRNGQWIWIGSMEVWILVNTV